MISEENNQERFRASFNEYRFQVNGTTNNVVKEMEIREENELAKAMQKYMPIGSVIKIKESFQKYMIIGFNCKSGNSCFDYLACEYPFGISMEHSTFMFNHDDIEKVFHIGFINNQEKSFKENLSGRGQSK